MKSKKITIAISLALMMTLGTVSCDTVKNLSEKNTTSNTNKEETIKKDNTTKQNNATSTNPKNNTTDSKSPDVKNYTNNQTQTSQTPNQGGVPKVQETAPEVKNQTPITENKTPTTESKTPVVENKTPTIDNNTSITNNPNEGKSQYQFMADVEQAIFKKVNEERAKAGVSALSYNAAMEKYARIKSKDMGDRGYFSHNDPEGRLITESMRSGGVTYTAWGENIAYISGVSDPTALANQFMTNWMNSQGHRANILSTNFSGIGVGVYKIGSKVYATQEFFR